MGFIPNERDCSKCKYWDKEAGSAAFCLASYCMIGQERREELNKDEGPVS